MISAFVIDFRSSSFCGTSACVQVGFLSDNGVAVRDGKRHTAGDHMFTSGAWKAFLEALRAGEFDRNVH
jgi:hypothetical protein